MITYQVEDMSCGHCVGAITKAVAAVDPGATLQFDVPGQRVSVEPAQASPAAIASAITAAGYTPVAVAGTPAQPAQGQRRSCCCS